MELTLGGLPGPTHNYAGLSFGNEASMKSAGARSNPRQAVLQSLQMLRGMLADGLTVGVLPPQARPDLTTVRRLGFAGTDAEVLAALSAHPGLLAKCASSSSMWAANAATVTPSVDAADGRVHLTPANLAYNFHRWLEGDQTTRTLRTIFAAEPFVVHDPLPAHRDFGDEGAANHSRVAPSHDAPGAHLFVYGVDLARPEEGPSGYPARQTLQASEAIARLHHLPRERAVFVQQRRVALDAGIFHNDVIAVANEHVLLCHEDAFDDMGAVLRQLEAAASVELCVIDVRREDFPLEDAVATYLFNSQLVTTGPGQMKLIAPTQVAEHPKARAVTERMLEGDNPVNAVQFLDLKQSMMNGGGPACLRLRVPLTASELATVHAPILIDEARLLDLEDWAERHYRDRLELADLADPGFVDEARTALDDLTGRLELGALYPFQQTTGR